MTRFILAASLAALLASAASAQLPDTEGTPPPVEDAPTEASFSATGLPVSGRPVPTLTAFDDAMQAYMADNSITAGVLGVMRETRIIYLRGFGVKYNGTSALPENALFRLDAPRGSAVLGGN